MAVEPPEEKIAEPGVVAKPPPTPDDTDRAFMISLRDAGLLRDLTDPLLAVIQESTNSMADSEARRMDLLSLYYRANGERSISKRRILQDRFFYYVSGEPVNAHGLVKRLAAVAPEVGAVSLERIGTDDGPLVLRAGEHLSAVTDDDEDDQLDTGEVDLATLEATISVSGLVRAMNVLLERCEVRERLVPLPSDGRREAYVAMGVVEAMLLCRTGHLDEESPETLMDFCAW